MKILCTADWHISNTLPYAKKDPNSLMSDRLADLEKILNWILEQANLKQLPLFVLGDIFDRRKPDAVALKTASRVFKKAAELDIKICVLPGNHDAHDTKGLHYAIEAIKLAGAPMVIMESGVVDEYNDVMFCPVPYQSRQATNDLIVEYGDMNIDKPKVLLLHDLVEGTVLVNNQISKDGLKFDLKSFDYILAGHVHNHTSIGENGCYIGSPTQMHFGECNHFPCIGMLSVGRKRIRYQKIDIPSEYIALFSDCAIDSKNIECGEIGEYNRLIFEGTKEELENNKPEIDRILTRQAAESRVSLFYHRDMGNRRENSLSADVLTDGLSLEDIVCKYVAMSYKSEKKRKELLSLVDEILVKL
jgi:DNA repair exonuclease SbcCD nuclease subunit